MFFLFVLKSASFMLGNILFKLERTRTDTVPGGRCLEPPGGTSL